MRRTPTQNFPCKEHFYPPTLSDTKLKATLISSGVKLRLFRPVPILGGSFGNFGMDTSPTAFHPSQARESWYSPCAPRSSPTASAHLGMDEQPSMASTSSSWCHLFMSLKFLNGSWRSKTSGLARSSPGASPLADEEPPCAFHSASNLNTCWNWNVGFIVSLGHDSLSQSLPQFWLPGYFGC